MAGRESNCRKDKRQKFLIANSLKIGENGEKFKNLILKSEKTENLV